MKKSKINKSKNKKSSEIIKEDISKNKLIEKQNREYKGVIKDGYIYYTYSKKVKMKDGSIKEYKNTVKRKRENKLNKRGKDKLKRKIGSGRPKKLKTKLNELINNLDEDKQKLIEEYIKTIS